MSKALISKPYSDALLALFVLCIAALLLVPLPTACLDLLISFNIAFSLLLLLIGLSLPNALALLTFPSLLLLTTLFRLSLNVASTRLILSQGDAGTIIRSFGTYLIRDEIVVGIIIFLIITVVNFIVIARGASRISEVAARFVLDALPGKQMAIDSDLRSGLITAQQAKVFRENLRKETQLYGSMDGAMKFVQGDVIAGVFIIFTNIFGGIYLGIKGGLSFADAISTYITLTIGDGLVTQIPALLVSICAGVVVTRVSSSMKDATLGSDLIDQLFSNRKIIFLAGLVVAMIGFMPGLPVIPFLVSGVFLCVIAFFLGRNKFSEQTVFGVNSDDPLSSGHNLIQVRLAPDLYRKYRENKNQYQQWWNHEKENFKQHYNLDLPDYHVQQDNLFESGQYELRTAKYSFDQGRVPVEASYLSIRDDSLQVLGFSSLVSSQDPLNYFTGNWISVDTQIEAEQAREAISFFQYLMLKVTSFYLSSPEELISLSDIHLELKELVQNYPGLFDALLENDFINPARLLEIKKELFVSGYHVNSLKIIMESLSQYIAGYGRDQYKQGDFDINDIIRFIRMERRKDVTTAYISSGRLFSVLLNDSAKQKLLGLEKAGLEEKNETIRSLKKLYNLYFNKSTQPVVLLVDSQLRNRLVDLLKEQDFSFPVISFSELSSRIEVSPVGLWAL